MGKFKGIVYLSEEQYLDMYNAKTLDENTQYVTPDTEQGSVDAYTKGETNELLYKKADKETTYTKTEVDDIKQNLQDQITTASGGEFTKVTVDGVYQATFNADTKANASDLQTTNTKVSSLEEQISSISVGIPVRDFIGV